VRTLLKSIGLEEQRIQMINLSSAMGGQFAFSAAEMTAEIRRLGPSPLGKNKSLDDNIPQSAEPPKEE
jgi:F420-non-reducing hydrogenase iron-sulfur subunit